MTMTLPPRYRIVRLLLNIGKMGRALGGSEIMPWVSSILQMTCDLYVDIGTALATAPKFHSASCDSRAGIRPAIIHLLYLNYRRLSGVYDEPNADHNKAPEMRQGPIKGARCPHKIIR